jgi:hypothetical protein
MPLQRTAASVYVVPWAETSLTKYASLLGVWQPLFLEPWAFIPLSYLLYTRPDRQPVRHPAPARRVADGPAFAHAPRTVAIDAQARRPAGHPRPGLSAHRHRPDGRVRLPRHAGCPWLRKRGRVDSDPATLVRTPTGSLPNQATTASGAGTSNRRSPRFISSCPAADRLSRSASLDVVGATLSS